MSQSLLPLNKIPPSIHPHAPYCHALADQPGSSLTLSLSFFLPRAATAWHIKLSGPVAVSTFASREL